ncbi:MAG: helix-turn-helix domain-containing protein [Candidatus Bathyarchaeia archaeon]
MIIPCEIAVKSVIPAIKALVAKELVEKHGLKQEAAAQLLGISQSAVSKYTRKVRGYMIEINKTEETESLINKMTTSLLNGHYERTEFLQIFCQTCIAIRKTRIMCQFCKKTERRLETETCDFCLTFANCSKTNQSLY